MNFIRNNPKSRARKMEIIKKIRDGEHLAFENKENRDAHESKLRKIQGGLRDPKEKFFLYPNVLDSFQS
jgi:hypothetical protein